MNDILVILLDQSNELLFRYASISEDIVYCRYHLMAYSSLDILSHVIRNTTSQFLPNIYKNKDDYVSAYLMRSGIKILVVANEKREKSVENICISVNNLVRKFIIESNGCDEIYESKEFSERIEALVGNSW